MLLIGLGVPTPEEKAQKIVLLYFDSFDWKYFDSFDWKQLGDFFGKMLALARLQRINFFPSTKFDIYIIGLSTQVEWANH